MTRPSLMFTKLIVADLEKSRTFYTAIADLQEVRRIESFIGERPMTEIILAPTNPGPGLILLSFDRESTCSTDELILGLAVREIDAVVQAVLDHGGSVLQAVDETEDAGIHVKVAFVRDPEGHIVELVEMGE